MEINPIDANELIECTANFRCGLHGVRREAVEKIFEYINDAPTLDYAPVVHGEWIPLEEPQWNCFGLVTIGYRCSECGREEPYNNEPYCHCGAKMGKGDA